MPLSATPDWFTCRCGKRGFLKRADAARERRGHRDRTHLGVYRCPAQDEPPRWHLGHKPAALTRGDICRDDIASRRKWTTHREDMATEYELADRYHREDHQ